MTGRASRQYLYGGIAALVCYLALPPVVGASWLFESVGLSAAIAITVGVARHRPRPMLPWVLFIVAQIVFVAGDFFYYTFDLQFPSPADGLYLAYYPLQAAGLLLLIRAQAPGRDVASLLDGLIITACFGLLSWIYLIEPYTHGKDSVLSSVVSIAYPTMDVLLFAVAVRLFLGTTARPPAFTLMMGSIAFLIVTDAAYGAIQLNSTYQLGSWLDAGWLISYLLWGAAALHPSMRELSSHASAGDTTLTTRRILQLATAVLIGPLTIGIDRLWPIAGFDERAAVIGTAVIFGLALVRVLGMTSSLQAAIAFHRRAELRETILLHAATALTAAPDREYVRLAALEGAIALTRDLPDAVVEVSLCNGKPHGDAAPGNPAQEFVVPIATRAAPYGRLVLTSRAAIPTDIKDALQTLGAHAALALEAVALSEGMSQQRSDARVAALVQNSTDLIMVIDLDLKVRYASPSVARALGHPPEDLIGCPAASLVESAQEETVAGFYSRLARHPGKSTRAEWRMRRADGRYTDVEAVVTNLLHDPSVQGIVVTAHDITDRKALEEGLKRQVRELEELDRIRSEFVATVSHELRTPLTSIIGEVEMLVDGDLGALTERQEHGVEVIGRNSERLLTLIDDLLTLSHIETGDLVLKREPMAVPALVADLRTQVAPAAEAKSLHLSMECGEDAGLVVADRSQLDRALSNLLSNAVKFTPSGGDVTLDAVRVGDDMVFTVGDNGMGIPREEQVRLFTRFFRSSTATKMAIQGTGLGLVIVKRIIEEHGGTIAIDSTPGVGTTVTVKIPANAADAATPAPVATPAPAPAHAPAPARVARRAAGAA